LVNETNGTGPDGNPLELLLADDFFFAAHDDVTGKIRLSERGVGLGLGAALLGELILFRKITLQGGEAIVIDRRPVRDTLVTGVLEELIREPETRPVRDWLRYLGRSAYELVGQRMVREGLVRVAQTRRFRRSPGYRPVNLNAAAWPIVRVAQKLARQEPIVLPDIVLAGLISATGLDRYLRSEAVADINDYKEHLVGGLPRPLRVLVAETEAAIGDAVLHHRM
jgi:hypothetical protein